MRFPLTDKSLPAVQAVCGKQGIVEGKDYRGVAVIAVTRAVPGSPCRLVTKIGRSEICHGSAFPVEVSVQVIYVEHKKYFQSIIRDISERKRAADEIRYISFHDTVTGLYNRIYFEQELFRLDTARELPISIIMGDVNNLKLTNDVFGHGEGDRLLRAIASGMKTSCREEDVIARWGGDEFIILLPETDYDTAAGICRRIDDSCRKARESLLFCSISLGVASKVKDTQDIMAVIKLAEERMYKNKVKVKGHTEIGYRIARTFPDIAHLADAILLHHERWNGTGYPKGAGEDDIPLLVRILAIIDAYDVMTHGRSYEPPRTREEAIMELERCAGTQFDPGLVKVFVNTLESLSLTTIL